MVRANFSVEIGNQFKRYGDLLSYVSKLEDLGFYGVYYDDILHWSDFECWSILAAIACSTRKIRLGPAMTFFSYRHPAVLAKAASTVDVVSGGRVEFRVGAGDIGVRTSSRLLGTPFPPPVDRVKQLREGVEIIKMLWSGKNTPHEGHFYKVSCTKMSPIPVQKPHPPISIAAKGRMMLEICVDHADEWESFETNPEIYEEEISLIEGICRRKRRRHKEIRRSLEVFVALNYDNKSMENTIRTHAKSMGISIDDPWLRKWLVGGIEKCRRFFSKFVDLGVSQFVIIPVTDNQEWFVEEFSSEIVKRFT